MKFIILLLLSFNILALNIQKWQTPEGATVLFEKTKGLDIVDIQLSFNAASSRDGALFGLANIVSNLFGTATRNKNREQIITDFENLGANFSASSYKDMSLISLRVLSEKDILLTATRLFSEVVGEAKFSTQQLLKAKQNILQNIKANAQSPAQTAQITFEQYFFDNHPYAHSKLGTKETIKLIHINDIRKFYKKYFVAKNMNIAIVGNISKPMAKQLARIISSKLNTGNRAKPMQKVNKINKKQKINIAFNSSQSHIIVGQSAVNRSHPDYYKIYLANHILGGSSLHSMLGESIRQKAGLAYSVYSIFAKMQAGNYIAIKLQTKKENTNQSLILVKKTLKKLLTGIDKVKLQNSKDNISGSFFLSLATNRSIVTYLSIIAFYQLPLDYIDKFSSNINKVSVKDIKNSLNNLIDVEKLLTIIVGI